jgi:hypothetical protein
MIYCNRDGEFSQAGGRRKAKLRERQREERGKREGREREERGKREGREREERGKREGREREERVERPFQDIFPTSSSLCLSLTLPSFFPAFL